MASGLHPETLTGGPGSLPEPLAVGDRVSYHSTTAGRQLNAEVKAVLDGGRYRVQSEPFVHADGKYFTSEKVLYRHQLQPARTNVGGDTPNATALENDSETVAGSYGGNGDSSSRSMTGSRKRPAEDEPAGNLDLPRKAARRGTIDKENAVPAAVGPTPDNEDDTDHEVGNPYWLGLGPEGVRRAIVPPADFQLDRLIVINDFGPTNAEDVKQVLAAYLPGSMADTVQVLCLHGGRNLYTDDTYPQDRTGNRPPTCWNAPGGNFHCFPVSNWLYRRDGHRVTFDESTSEKHNNTWGHVHPKMLLAVFKRDDCSRMMYRRHDASVSSSQEVLRVSVLTNGPFGGGVCNGRCEYAAWYSQLFPVAQFGNVTCSDFGNHLHDFIIRLVEAADKEHADNPLYFPPGQVHCQCGMGKSGACKAEDNDGRPSCTVSVMELLRVVTHADCSAADAVGFRVVSSVIGHTDPSDRCQYGHVRVNTLASQFWGSDDQKMEKTPTPGSPQAVASPKAPTYTELMTQDEKNSDLSLVIIVHNIAAGCTPRFLSNFGACWKIAKQQNVRIAWPAAACLMGDPDNPKIEGLCGPWLKGFDYKYRSDTYSTSSQDTIKGKRHAVWQGDDHDGYNYLFKYEPHLLLPTPRRFGRWSGWKDDDPTAGPGLLLEIAQEGALTSARSDTQLRNAAPLLSDAVEEKRRIVEFEKALWRAEVESSKRHGIRSTTAGMQWSCSGGEVTGSNQHAPFINAFSTTHLSRWADEATVGETLSVRGLDRAGRNRVRDTIRHSDSLSTVLTTESIGYGDDRWLRITKQPYEARRYAHHFQQYVVLDGNQNPVAFLLTSANLSSFAWGEQCQCGEELPSFGLVPERDHRGTSDCYNASTGSHDFWMRNFEFGIMDLQPGRRGGRADCTPQSECAAQLETHWRPHALPIAVNLRNMKRFEPWEEPWCTRAHERLCERVDEKHMAILQKQLLDFAKPSNLGKIFPMDTALTRDERSQVRDICREICDPDFKRDIPPWLQKDRVPSNADKECGQTRVRSGRIGRYSPALWLDHYVREAVGTLYGTQLVVTLTTKQDYMSRQPVAWIGGAKHPDGDSESDQEYDLEGRVVDRNGSPFR